MKVQVLGIANAKHAMTEWARQTQIRGVRIALNAAMGDVKRQVVANLSRHQDSGLLVKSQRVKVTVPLASKNPSHRDKPAVGLVGAGRGLVAITTKRGKQKILTGKQKAAAKAAGTKVRRASRYSHLPEAKHRDLANAAVSAAPQAHATFARKIGEVAIQEAKRLASKP